MKLQLCWLRTLTPVTYSSKLPGIPVLAALLQLQLFCGFYTFFRTGYLIAEIIHSRYQYQLSGDLRRFGFPQQ
ncbi:hypothetical protein BSQ96_11860 [Serratia proteamaculans]|nr:hypothetical protein BSQ96_11860 [Serratia proteamaculans]